MKLTTLRPRVATLDTRVAKALPKETAGHYGSSEHKAWALEVKRRAGWRCEYVENGVRCPNRHPMFRMYADHIQDIKDRPDLAVDLSNGRCACNSHNTSAGIAARSRRMGS